MIPLNRARLVFHGAVILILSLLCGLPLFLAVQEGWGEEAVRFWRSVHVGLAAVGVWSIATGAVIGYLVLGTRGASILGWSVIVSNYAIAVAILIRALAMPLHLDVGSLPLRSLVAAFRNVSAIAGFVAAIVTLRGASAAVRVAKGGVSHAPSSA
jgi:hypothetical protein